MKKVLFLLMIAALCITASAEADQVGDLFDMYVEKLNAEKVTLTLSEQPDSTGLVKEAYFESKSAVVKEYAVDSVKAYVKGLQLNPPTQWGSKGQDIKLSGWNSVSLIVNLLEDDINDALKDKNFSFEDADNRDGNKYTLHDITVDITTEGITATGKARPLQTSTLASYAAAFLMGSAADDYEITVTASGVKVQDNEMWLEGLQVTGDQEAINQKIRVNLSRHINLTKEIENFDQNPITVGSIELKDGSITIKTVASPTAITGGTTYTYPKSASNNGNGNNNNNNENNNAGDSTNNNNSSDNSSEIDSSTLNNLTDAEKENLKSVEINNRLGSLAETYPFKALQSTSTGTTENITEAQLTSALGSNESSKWNSYKKLPTQIVYETGTYILGSVSLKEYKAGTKIALFMLTKAASGSGFTVASLSSENYDVRVAEVSEGAFFTNTNGTITEEVPESGEVIAIAPMEAGVEYTPVITLAEESTSKSAIKSSGDGCNIGVGVMAFAILSLAFFKKH